ncbi:MAG: Ig-like domain repeat protein [Anaerolineae bacterium]|nr:Ig-like domain repeat protein [Anaerolineae bacterium]
MIEDGSCSPTFSGDPFLGPLANNGGSTPTHALLPGSPAINAGNNTSCLTTDQRGIARPQQGQCDIGAFESRGFTLTRNGGHNQSTPIGSPFSTPLGVTVTSSAGEPMSGGFITFTGPGSGASTNPVSVTAVISGSAASAAMTANNVVGGPYNVAANAKGTNSVNFSLTNTKATPAVIIASSANPSLFGQTVTFTAIVTSNAGTPAGSLIFVVDGTPQSPVALAGGQATFSTSSLAVGNHTISANYSGDASFNTSSGSLTNGQTVNPLDAPTVQFTQAVYTTTESIGTSQSVILTRIGNLANASQVQVSLSGGTATAGTDYSSAGFPKTITFGSGVASQTVPIAVINDTQVEPSETISLTLSSLGNAVIGVPSSAGLQIEDNDTAAASFKVYLPTVIK